MSVFNFFCKDEKGGGLVEYTLIILLIALVSITAMTSVGTKLGTAISSIAAAI